MCFQIPDFIEKENFPTGSLDLYLFFSHWGSFAAKTVSSNDPGHWHSEAYSLMLLGLIRQDKKGSQDQLLKWAAMVTIHCWRLSTIGDRTFPVAAAHFWNSLLQHVTPATTEVMKCKFKFDNVRFPDRNSTNVLSALLSNANSWENHSSMTDFLCTDSQRVQTNLFFSQIQPITQTTELYWMCNIIFAQWCVTLY